MLQVAGLCIVPLTLELGLIVGGIIFFSFGIFFILSFSFWYQKFEGNKVGSAVAKKGFKNSLDITDWWWTKIVFIVLLGSLHHFYKRILKKNSPPERLLNSSLIYSIIWNNWIKSVTLDIPFKSGFFVMINLLWIVQTDYNPLLFYCLNLLQFWEMITWSNCTWPNQLIESF